MKIGVRSLLVLSGVPFCDFVIRKQQKTEAEMSLRLFLILWYTKLMQFNETALL